MIDTEGVFSDLVSTLEARGIKPIGQTDELYKYTEHRIVGDFVEPSAENESNIVFPDQVNELAEFLQSLVSRKSLEKLVIAIALKILRWRKCEAGNLFEIVEGRSDELNGMLGLSSTLAVALSRAEPEDEVTVHLDGETRRLMFVALENTEKEAA